MTEPSLGAVRDLLLPGLRMEGGKHPQLELDIQIDADALLIKGYNTSTKKSLGFAITRARINDGSYKTSFRPALQNLITLLSPEDVEC